MALNGAQLLIYPTAIGGVGTDSKEEQQTQRQAWQLVQRGAIRWPTGFRSSP